MLPPFCVCGGGGNLKAVLRRRNSGPPPTPVLFHIIFFFTLPVTTMANDSVFETFAAFTSTLDDPNISPEEGLDVIHSFELDDDMRSRADMMKEWDHWVAGAEAAAALNAKLPHVTEDGVYTVAAKYVLLDDLICKPRYNMCASLMHFAVHQLRHAFGRIHGLPYPHADGSRTHNDPGSALEVAFNGSSVLEDAVHEMWRDFLLRSGERARLPVHEILGDDTATE